MGRLTDFAFGTRNLNHSLRTITIIDGVVIDASADLIVGKTLNQEDQYALAVADLVQLELLTSTKVGTTTFDIVGIEASYDGTNYFVAETFGAALTISTAVQSVPIVLTKRIVGAQKIRLKVANVTADGSNHMVLSAALKIVCK